MITYEGISKYAFHTLSLIFAVIFGGAIVYSFCQILDYSSLLKLLFWIGIGLIFCREFQNVIKIKGDGA